MALVEVSCVHCHSSTVYKHGFSTQGKQRYRCLDQSCRKTFLLDYTKQGFLQSVNDQVVDMAVNGSGICDTARVLKISPVTVISTLKKSL